MPLFYLTYSFSYSPTENNRNPRICQLAIKQDANSFEFVEAKPTDENIFPANFSTKKYQFVVYVGGSPVYDSTSLTPASKLSKDLLAQDSNHKPKDPEITMSPLPSGGTTQTTTPYVPPTAPGEEETPEEPTPPPVVGENTTTVKVYLSSGNEDQIVTVKVKSLSPMVPMLSYEDIPNAPDLRINQMFHPRVTASGVSSFRIHQLIDQADIQRGLGIAFADALIPNFSSGVGTGYGTWEIYNKDPSSKSKDFSPKNFDLYIRLAFEARSFSMSMDVHQGFSSWDILGIAGSAAIGSAGGGESYSVAGSQNVQILKTYESQKVRYDYSNKTVEDILKKVKSNFGKYSETYSDPSTPPPVSQAPAPTAPGTPGGDTSAAVPTTPIPVPGSNDVDGDGTASIVDRIVYLSSLGYSNLKNEDALNVFGKNAENELKELISKYSIIGKSVVLKDVTNLRKASSISYNGKTASSLAPLSVYFTEKKDVYVVFEEGTLDSFVSKDPENSSDINYTKKYTIYAKCLVPEWNSCFDYFNNKNNTDIFGVSSAMNSIFSQLFSDKNARNLSVLSKEGTDPLILLVVRNKVIISDSNDANSNTPKKIAVRNRNHNDTIIEQGAEQDDSTEETNAFRSNYFIAEVPLDKDYTIDNVGYVESDVYYELVPGYGLQVRVGHGFYFDTETEVALAQSRIQGELVSPWIILNPLQISDILDGSNSFLRNGTTLEIFSNMGRERTSSGLDIPFFSPTAGQGNLGGNLDYLCLTVTETADIFTPSLISFKSNVNSKEEYVTFKDQATKNVINYKVLAGNQRFASPVSNFSLDNTRFENIKTTGSIYSDSSNDAIQLDDVNEKYVDIVKSQDEFIIENLSATGINEISQIYFKTKSSSNKTFPYVLFYETSNSSLSNLSENSTMIPFGFTDSNGKIVPKIFNLVAGNNYLSCKNLVDVTKVKIKPAEGIDSKIDFSEIGDLVSLEGEEGTKAQIHGSKDTLNKNPIGHIRLEQGDQFLILEVVGEGSSPTTIVAAEINTQRSKLNYPNLFSDEQQIADNYRLENFVTSEFIASSKKSSSNQYYLLGYMDEANIVDDPMGVFYLIGFLYDESGSKTNALASIPIPKRQLSRGESIFDIHKVFTQFLSSEGDSKSTDPDKGKFPFFYNEKIKDFIIDKEFPKKQKPGVCKIGKNTIKMIFMSSDEGKIVCYFNDNIGRQWKKMPDNFVNNIYNFTDISINDKGIVSRVPFKNQDSIVFHRFACSKETFESSLYLFSLCEIKGNKYYVLMKRVSYRVLDFYMNQANENPNSETEEEILDLLTKEKPILAIGDPNLIFPDENLKIHVGNSQKNNESNGEASFTSIQPLKNDNEIDEQSQPLLNENLSTIQNVDISQDLKSGTIKIYFINNKGVRDCKASLSSGMTWQSFTSF